MKTPDYSKCQIYKIVCKDLAISDCYIGNTCSWIQRKSDHKRSSNNETRREYYQYKYKFIREHGGWDNWSMVLIEDYPCETRIQAEQRERYWIETINATLNINIPSRPEQEMKAEYYKNNKEYIKERQTQYAKKNKERIKEYKQKWCEDNRDKISEHNRTHYLKTKI